MNVTGLDGRTYSWDLAGKIPLKSEEDGSSGHKLARELLCKLFPLDRRLEEVVLPGTGGLRADFFLPRKMLVVEVHGAQHYQYVKAFHATWLDFMRGQARDRAKVEFCELNKITFCELPDHERDSWEARVLAAAAGRQYPGGGTGPGA